jgi:hypothetical protein
MLVPEQIRAFSQWPGTWSCGLTPSEQTTSGRFFLSSQARQAQHETEVPVETRSPNRRLAHAPLTNLQIFQQTVKIFIVIQNRGSDLNQAKRLMEFGHSGT